MMIGNDQDLGLSLSLSFSSNHHHHQQQQQKQQQPPNLQLNLMPSLINVPSSGFNNSPNIPQKPSWLTNSFPSSDPTCDPSRADDRSFLRGIDVNRLPLTAVDAEEEAGVSSPNSTISSVSGKRSERETGHGIEDHDNERSCSRGNSDEEDGENSRKKLRLSKDQSAVLEESFKDHNTLNPKQKSALAKQLGLRPRQVEVWFQNRRARTKLKQTEVDCEFLKRCCENLTEENRRLQKEVIELRALKLSPQLYMQMTPPTTLTICPSCERVGVPPPSSSSADHRAHRQNNHQFHHRPTPISQWAPAVPFDSLRPRS